MNLVCVSKTIFSLCETFNVMFVLQVVIKNKNVPVIPKIAVPAIIQQVTNHTSPGHKLLQLSIE